MKGSYRVIIQNKDVKYDFTLNRNITIIKGNSATGKTTLVGFIEEFYENGAASGIQLRCEKKCAVLSGRNWQVLINNFKDSIVFIDEGNKFVHSREFARALQNSDNYYVIITRENLVNLPYSVTEIYGIRESGKYAGLKQTYNEFYRIYAGAEIALKNDASTVLVEDSNSGFQFFKVTFDEKNYHVISAEGKSNIFSKLNNLPASEKILVIADGAAFGAEMDRVMRMVTERKNIALYLPESFEWIILKSGIIDGVDKILANPGEYIESAMYFSWERFFTELLVERTQGTFLQYAKKKLNNAYLQEKIKNDIITVMKPVSV